jgi:hypothetical protein
MARVLKTGTRTTWDLLRCEREKKWRAHLAAWQRSGLSQAAYCRREGLTPSEFSWWKCRLARSAEQKQALLVPAGQAGGTFVPFQLPGLVVESKSAPCEVVLKNGRRLWIESGAAPEWIAALARALEQVAPC